LRDQLIAGLLGVLLDERVTKNKMSRGCYHDDNGWAQ